MKTSITRRTFLGAGAAATLAAGAGSSFGRRGRAMAADATCPACKETFGLLDEGKKIPVILDTDIGGDIDDTWALVMLLKSPELDVKLITSDSGNDTYRAKIIAKMLEVAGRTDIPVGVGCKPGDKPDRQSEWVGDYDLDKFPGTVHQDGVGAIIETIRASQQPITLVAIGPVPNVAEVLRRAPDVAQKSRFVGMHGSVRRGYGGSTKISAEYNVRADAKALQQVFAAEWDVTITPLDTCGIVRLEGQRFQKVYRCPDPSTQALIKNYQAWRAAREKKKSADLPPPDRSSILFDTVAVYLAFTEKLLNMETLPLRVTDDGYTKIDNSARPVHCAMTWKDLDAFNDDLVRRLTARST